MWRDIDPRARTSASGRSPAGQSRRPTRRDAAQVVGRPTRCVHAGSRPAARAARERVRVTRHGRTSSAAPRCACWRRSAPSASCPRATCGAEPTDADAAGAEISSTFASMASCRRCRTSSERAHDARDPHGARPRRCSKQRRRPRRDERRQAFYAGHREAARAGARRASPQAYTSGRRAPGRAGRAASGASCSTTSSSASTSGSCRQPIGAARQRRTPERTRPRLPRWAVGAPAARATTGTCSSRTSGSSTSDRDGRRDVEDVEVMTPHYRGAHAAAKVRAGLHPYRAVGAGGWPRGRPARSGSGRRPALAEELLRDVEPSSIRRRRQSSDSRRARRASWSR